MDQTIEGIMSFIFHHFGEKAQLKIGIQDEGEGHTFYATIEGDPYRQFEGVFIGESSYGSDSLAEALTELENDIQEWVPAP